MLDYIVTDIELRNAILREWRERPAYVAVVREFGEFHPLHVATSSATIGGTLPGADMYVISGFWAPVMPLLPGGAVSTAIGSGLKPDSVWVFNQNFKSTEGITHRQHRERNVQLPPRRPPSMRG